MSCRRRAAARPSHDRHPRSQPTGRARRRRRPRASGGLDAAAGDVRRARRSSAARTGRASCGRARAATCSACSWSPSPPASWPRRRWRCSPRASGASRRWPRSLLAALALILLVAGVPLWYLRPDRWDTLSVNLGNAIVALPDLRMPYRGNDAWVRAVLVSRRRPAAAGRRDPRARAAAADAGRPRYCLGVLYVVAIIEHRPSHPYLDGIVFSLLLGAMLWGERLSGREAPVGGDDRPRSPSSARRCWRRTSTRRSRGWTTRRWPRRCRAARPPPSPGTTATGR